MKKLRLKKKNAFIALAIVIFIIIEIINPTKLIAVSKLIKMKYSKEASQKIIKLGLKNDILENEYNKFIDLNVIDENFNNEYYDYYKDINYDKKINMNIVNKLKEKGYSSKETSLILKREKESDIENFLEKDKYDSIISYLEYDYAKLMNLDRYINYKNKNGLSFEEVVTNVNLGLDNEFYTNYREVDKFNFTMLVNKYNKLSSSFVPDDLISFSSLYCKGNCPSDNKEVVNAFERMAKDLYEEEKLNIYVNSAYRSYKEQEETYNRLTKLYGSNYDVAKAGFSEHQTGLCVDIKAGSSNTFKGSKEEKWLNNNAYKYGFILRYPSNKVKITGYNEVWHYRYVGSIAEDVKKSGLTFDEYYVKYLDK